MQTQDAFTMYIFRSSEDAGLTFLIKFYFKNLLFSLFLHTSKFKQIHVCILPRHEWVNTYFKKSEYWMHLHFAYYTYLFSAHFDWFWINVQIFSRNLSRPVFTYMHKILCNMLYSEMCVQGIPSVMFELFYLRL